MRRKGTLTFFVVALFIILFTMISFTGIYTTYGDVTTTRIKGVGDMRWGIDIRGGVDVTFTPPEGYNATDIEMGQAESILKDRLVTKGITDYEIYTDTANDRVIVRFPWKGDEADFNPEAAIKELGETSVLAFYEGRDVDENGLPTGTLILEGKDVEQAYAAFDSQTSDPIVSLTLTSEGAVKFAEATARLYSEGGAISIWMDNNNISTANVAAVITDGNAMISGNFTTKTAQTLADQINGGALPFKLVSENYSTISPSLGLGAKDTMVLAGVLTMIAVFIFMVGAYRLPGFVAFISLVGQVGGMIACLTGFFGNFPSFTLTLPGIAGIILSIGFGVDANVITAERIKEEIREGKTLGGAIENGFTRGFSAILDGNVTVIIISVILMGAFGPPSSLFAKILKPVFFMFGPSTTGTIYSFGFTLLIGIIFNMVMGVYASHAMLKSISKFKSFRNPWLYGGLKSKIAAKPKRLFDFIGNRNRFFIISSALIAITILVTAIFGVLLDIEFKGGSILTYSYVGNLDKDSFSTAMDTLVNGTVTVQQSIDAGSGKETLVVSLPGSSGASAEELLAIAESLRTQFPDNDIQSIATSNVDPVMGREFLLKCVIAVVVASVLVIAYIALRFRKIGGWSAGIMAMAALFHDMIIVFAVFILFRIPINDNFIAVILTILGFSLNDTIVIYDRIRENQRLFKNKMPLGELVNLSINQSITRSVNTTMCALLGMAIVTILALAFNVDSILSFSLPMLFGLISGAYSTICLAGPLWVMWKTRSRTA